ncbi:MAG TPA: Gfo/Idh/MocA family oxidoreductase [Bacteroidota bacterium]|nr:Gfo/Idh/MocA family oxidoreductase [Bacteroidota bacterium]
MSDSISIGVIGVGHLGSLHVKMLSGIDGVRLAGVFDIDRSRADEVAGQYRTTVAGSVEDILRVSDAVCVVTPTSTHHEIASRAIAAGRHVFIEKPICATVSEADDLIRLARAHGVRIQVGHIERFNPALLALKEYELRPMFIESHRLAQFNPRGTDVAVVLDLMIHDIDVIVSLVNSPVARIEANGVAVVSPTIDIANARVQFENGCVANVTASRISQKKMRKMRLFQRDTYISIDFSEGLAEVFRLAGDGSAQMPHAVALGQIDTGTAKRTILYEQPEVREVNALKYELEQFRDTVRTGQPPVVTAEAGREALHIASAILRKIEEQKLVM